MCLLAFVRRACLYPGRWHGNAVSNRFASTALRCNISASGLVTTASACISLARTLGVSDVDEKKSAKNTPTAVHHYSSKMFLVYVGTRDIQTSDSAYRGSCLLIIVEVWWYFGSRRTDW